MEDLELKVSVKTDEAVTNLDNLASAANKAKESVEGIGQAAEEAVPTVQGLGKAFESAFSTVVSEGSKAGGTLGDVFKSIRTATPVVKKINDTALTGLKGIRAAIAATGIGALITAIALVTTHWEGFLKAIGSSKEKFEEFKNKAIDSVGNVVAGIVGVGNVIIQYLITPVKTAIQYFSGLGRVIKDIFTGNWKEIGKDIETALGNIKDTISNGFDTKAAFEKGKEAGQKFVQGVKTTLTYKASDVGKETADTLSGGSSGKGTAYRKAGEKAGKEFGEGLDEGLKQALGKLEGIYQGIIDEERLKEEVEHLKTEVLPNLLRPLQEIPGIPSVSPDWISILSEEDLEELAKNSLKYKDQLDALGKLEEKDQISHEKALKIREALDKKFNEDQRKIVGERIELRKEEADQEEKEAKKTIAWTEEYNYRLAELDYQRDIQDVEQSLLPEKEKNQKLYEMEQQRLQEKKVYLETLLALEEEGTEEYIGLLEKIMEVENQLATSRKKKEDDDTKTIEDERREAKAKVLLWADAAQSIGDLLGTIADAEEDRIQRQLEAGEIEKEEAERQFETVKGWQIAETWINTLAGMTAALTSPVMQEMGIPGWIAAAAQAATLLANGIAQTAKIRNTKFGDSGGSGGKASVPNVGVTPIDVRDDIQESPTVLANSQSPTEQQVFILQGDLEDSHRQVQIREGNTTF